MCKDMSFGAWLTNGWYFTRFYFKAWFTKYFKGTNNNLIEKSGYRLVFSDEFDKPIDWEKWETCEEWGCVRDQVIFKQSQVTQSNSDVILTSDINNVQNEPKAKTGGIYSWNSFNTKYGYFETREKLSPSGLKYWPAFWLSSSDSWPPEIDIFECMGWNSAIFTMTLHWRDTWTNEVEIQKVYNEIYLTYGYLANNFEDTLNYLKQPEWTQQKQDYIDELESLTNKKQKGRKLIFPQKDFLSKDYHIFACEWSPEKIIWYIDNLPVYVLDKNIPDRNMFILINANYTYTNDPIPSELPMSIYCDYIRCYKKN